ncbi:MAG: glucosaminidase domain-containing protein [Eubacteriales bacterium]|nr:glucosaminidase domain-containing protein [Eubacteriales bacterium]
MNLKKTLVTALLMALLAMSALLKPNQNAAATPEQIDTFINGIAPYAVDTARANPALYPSIMIAQACLETGYGQSVPQNNIFGIKSLPGKPERSLETTEVVNGERVTVTAGFAVFNDYADAFQSYAALLMNAPVYESVRNAGSPEAAAHALTGTYATDPRYARSLLWIINTFDLRRFDKQATQPVVPETPTPQATETTMTDAPKPQATETTLNDASKPQGAETTLNDASKPQSAEKTMTDAPKPKEIAEKTGPIEATTEASAKKVAVVHEPTVRTVEAGDTPAAAEPMSAETIKTNETESKENVSRENSVNNVQAVEKTANVHVAQTTSAVNDASNQAETKKHVAEVEGRGNGAKETKVLTQYTKATPPHRPLIDIPDEKTVEKPQANKPKANPIDKSDTATAPVTTPHETVETAFVPERIPNHIPILPVLVFMLFVGGVTGIGIKKLK